MEKMDKPKPPEQKFIIDDEVYRLLAAGDSPGAWSKLSDEVRLKLLGTPPFGEPWSQHLPPQAAREQNIDNSGQSTL